MVAERRPSVPESVAYLALLFSLLRPDLQEQIKLNEASSANPLAINSSPYNLTGLAFTTPYGTNAKVDNWLYNSKEAMATGGDYDPLSPLSQYLNWQPDARFDADAVAMILGDSAPRTHLRSLDSESGYSSDDAKSPLSTSSYNEHSEPDLSELGAAGYTPPSDLAELLNTFEEYVDINSFQTTEPHKGILDVQDSSNQFDLSGYDGKQELNFYPNKLSPSEDFLYSPEYKMSPDGSDFQDSLGIELKNEFSDPFTIDFGNTFANSSYEFGNDLDKEIDLDSFASLDFGLPLDLLNPTQQADNQVENQLNQLIQEPVTTRANGGFQPLASSSSSARTENSAKSTAISLPVHANSIDTLSTLQRSEQHRARGISPTAKKVTATKSKSLKTDDFPLGLTEQKIIDMPVNEFNILLEKLSEKEAKLVRDVRRRGKNKEAARVCRKRKIDAIDSLDDELQMMREKKNRILEERKAIKEETASLKSKIKELENSVINSLRDENGRPLSSLEYSIFQGPNGAVYVGKTITDKGKKKETS